VRKTRWGVLVTLLAFGVAVLIMARDPYARNAQGDGHYAWLFARSIVYDGDIDFKNDYAACGDPWAVGVDRGTGHPNNNFAFGHAIFWIPALELARVFIRIPASAPPAIQLSCEGPRVAAVLYASPVVGALTIFLAYLVARRLASDGAAALAAGLIGIAGTNLAYAGFMVSYSHIYASFAVALLIWSTLRADEISNGPDASGELGRWSLVAFAIALAELQRPTALVFAILPFVLTLRTWVRRRWSRGRVVVVLTILATGVVAGALPTLLVNRYLFGSPWAVPQGRYFLFFAHAHPWLVLFAPRGGLFYSAPTAWLGVIGLGLAFRDPKWRLVFAALAVSAALEIFIASSALDWHGSWGFGARRLTTLTPMLVAAAALLLERARRWVSRKRTRASTILGLGALAAATLFGFGVVDGSAHNAIVPDSGHSQADFYGAGSRWVWRLLDENVGDLAILPAEIAFSARYHLPCRSFRDATEPFAYVREQRGDLHFNAQQFPLGDPRMMTISTGLSSVSDALRFNAPRARIVFAAEWPFATAYEVTIRDGRSARLRVGVGHAFGAVTWLVASPAAVIAQKSPTIRFSIPRGEFDSGINEIVLEDDDPSLEITSFRILDEASYPPAFAR